MAIEGHEVGSAVCEALGLVAADTKSIDIHMDAGGAVTAHIVHFVTADEGAHLVEVLSKYVLATPDDDVG